jgi:hypothetical protein
MMEDWNIGETNCLSNIPLFHFFLCAILLQSLEILVSKNIPPTFTLWSMEAYSTGQALPLEGGVDKTRPRGEGVIPFGCGSAALRSLCLCGEI